MMTANELKTYIIGYLRFKRHIKICATEVNFADIIAYDSSRNKLIEIETKVSKQDFLNDFNKPKHKRTTRRANLFYFGVTHDIRDFVCQYLAEHNSPYGVISYDEFAYEHDLIPQRIGIYRGANLLNNDDNRIIKEDLINRMASEIYALRSKLYVVKRKKPKEKFTRESFERFLDEQKVLRALTLENDEG